MWRRVLSSPLAPKISMLVPAYNEELSVCGTVRSLLALSYPNLEVVVVNDGSQDRTVAALVKEFDLRPVHPIYQRLIQTAEVRGIYKSNTQASLVLVDKFNGGKADSLNAGLNVAAGDLVCAIDADTLVGPQALHQLVAPFLTRGDTVAVGGTVRLTNDSKVRASAVPDLVVPRSMVAAFQVVEYVRAFIVGRLGWNALGGNLIISGAFGLFRRQSVLDAGGYETGSIGEDMELIVRLRRARVREGRKGVGGVPGQPCRLDRGSGFHAGSESATQPLAAGPDGCIAAPQEDAVQPQVRVGRFVVDALLLRGGVPVADRRGVRSRRPRRWLDLRVRRTERTVVGSCRLRVRRLRDHRDVVVRRPGESRLPQLQIPGQADHVRHPGAVAVSTAHDLLATVGRSALPPGANRVGPAGPQGLHHRLIRTHRVDAQAAAEAMSCRNPSASKELVRAPSASWPRSSDGQKNSSSPMKKSGDPRTPLRLPSS